jgi:hypothetical protein
MVLATDAGECSFSTDLDACASCSGETDGTGTIVVDGALDGVCETCTDGLIVDNDLDDDDICDDDEVIGCQDVTACDYMVLATDAGECSFSTDLDACASCSGETDGAGTIVDNDADDDGVCDDDELIGCQDETACDYNELATDAGVCEFISCADYCGEPNGSNDCFTYPESRLLY